jgi:hypothetical protein
MALGVINPSLVLSHFCSIFSKLKLNCEIIEEKELDDSETRMKSIKSLE